MPKLPHSRYIPKFAFAAAGSIVWAGCMFWRGDKSSRSLLQSVPTTTELPQKQKQKQKQNRTLVVLAGQLRCNERCYQSIYENVLDVNMADLAIIGNDYPSQHDRRNISLFSRAKYIWEIPDYGGNSSRNWDAVIDSIGTSQDANVTWLDVARKSDMAFGGTSVSSNASGAIIFLTRWYLQQKLQPLLPLYDRYVVTRPDNFFLCPHSLEDLQLNTSNNIWVPTGQDWGGICDRYLATSADHIIRVLNVLEPIVRHPQKYLDVPKTEEALSNTESVLKLHLEMEGLWDLVRRFPRDQFLAGMPTDSYGWVPARSLVRRGPAKGLYLKYRPEFHIAIKNCNDRQRQQQQQHQKQGSSSLQQ